MSDSHVSREETGPARQRTAPPARKRAVLGGSFDPVHLGHLGMAETARETVGLDEVVFMPCFVSPFKKGTIASSDQRIEMLRIALQETKMSGATLSEFEINRPKPSYSWETARYLSREFPDIKWHWIVGTDQWSEIERWAEPGILQELLHFIVLTRDNQPIVDRKGWSYTAIPFQHPASSTRIRTDFEKHVDWLVPGVAEYCREEGIYS